MDNYKHKSGAKKRKEREQKLENEKKGLRTLFHVGVELKKPESLPEAVLTHNTELDDAEPTASTSTSGNYCLPSVGTHYGSNSSQIEFVPISESENIISLNVNLESDTEVAGLEIPPILEVVEEQCDILDFGDVPEFPTKSVVERFVVKGPTKINPEDIPNDGKRAFPRIVLHTKTKNGELRLRDWLTWSTKRQSLYCFPCRLLSSPCELTNSNKSVLMSQEGWKKEMSWRKLYDKIPNHEASSHHKQCYIEWRALENRLKGDTCIQNQLDDQLVDRKKYWHDLLERLLSVIMFLAERGLLPFRGDSSKIGDAHNGNFLGIIELLSKYDPLLREHVTKVKESQDNNTRLSAHYLSWRSQNEFIEVCGKQVVNKILTERKNAKYYAILVDATPDVTHEEQVTFILRYLLEQETGFKIAERFLSFVKCNKKTGEDLAIEILKELANHGIPLKDCRGQGFDNGANMVGVYKGVQARISELNPYALFSNCAAHSLNLCGVNAAESCQDAVTFFGVLQKLYNFFSKSPQRWEILQEEIQCSLHKLSDTRWSARVDAVKPFAKHLPGLQKVIAKCMTLNMTAESKTELLGIQKYLKSFKCIIMSTMWFKILVSVDHRNKVLQLREVTLDKEVSYIENLMEEMISLRNTFSSILEEAKLVANAMASQMATETEFSEKRKTTRKRFHEETSDEEYDHQNSSSESKEERYFRINVFYRVIDCVIGGLRERFNNARKLSEIFQCLWQYLDKDETEIGKSCQVLISTYPEDISEVLVEELIHLKSIHVVSFGASSLPPFELLNQIKSMKLELLYPNVCIALRLFCTLPVSVAGAERSFSALKRIKSYSRSTMGQERLCGLTTLAMESDLARTVDFSDIINDFANKKARKIIM